MAKELAVNPWIDKKYQMPPLDADGEPYTVELLTDEKEVIKGYFERGEWWIEQPDPFVGHVSLRTHPLYWEVTHWRYSRNE